MKAIDLHAYLTRELESGRLNPDAKVILVTHTEENGTIAEAAVDARRKGKNRLIVEGE